MILQLARPEDTFTISQLYFEVYEGTYPDPMMKDFNLIRSFILSPTSYWFIAKSDDGQVMASVLAIYDEKDSIVKAFGAVVRTECRSKGVMEKLLGWGIDYLRRHTPGVAVIYSTTRTVNEAAQTLTEKLGFKKLGIFPNAHKTSEYETHCLTAIIEPKALEQRKTDYCIHHKVASLYRIVQDELGLGPLETIVPEKPGKFLNEPGDLEVVNSPKFVAYRYSLLRSEQKLEFEFFPFHLPNLMIISPDQKTELFCHLSPVDGHCVVIGGKMEHNMNFGSLFLKTNQLLRNAGARYIEALVRADRPKIVDSIMKAKFIPCAFIPAFQKVDDKRIDFIVFSRSFEIFDFQNVKLKGLNQVYLREYFLAWKQTALNPKLLDV